MRLKMIAYVTIGFLQTDTNYAGRMSFEICNKFPTIQVKAILQKLVNA